MTAAAAPPRWTEYMPVADLAPALKNAKAHDQVAMGASFRAFGALEPVVLDERTQRLVAGHGRVGWLATAEAQGSPPPDWGDESWPPEGVWVDEAGRWRWLVTRGFTSHDDDHAHAAGIALNRVGERGGWEVATLTEMLDELIGTPLVDAAGFTADELDDLIAQAGGQVLDPEGTDAAYAAHEGRGDPQAPRSVQGLHEVGLMFGAEQYREYVAHVATLRRRWAIDAAPAIVLSALRAAVGDE